MVLKKSSICGLPVKKSIRRVQNHLKIQNQLRPSQIDLCLIPRLILEVKCISFLQLKTNPDMPCLFFTVSLFSTISFTLTSLWSLLQTHNMTSCCASSRPSSCEVGTERHTAWWCHIKAVCTRCYKKKRAKRQGIRAVLCLSQYCLIWPEDKNITFLPVEVFWNQQNHSVPPLAWATNTFLKIAHVLLGNNSLDFFFFRNLELVFLQSFMIQSCSV